MAEVTMRQMLEAGVHFGHRTRFWSPKMRPYIFGVRNKIHIINLEKTLPLYIEATKFLGKIAEDKGTILIVGTKRQASNTVQEQAERCGCPYVNHRWLGGMLTNFKTIKNSITRLNELEELTEGSGVARRTKKETLQLERERLKLGRSLSGIRNMKYLPDALFVIDVDNERIAVSEARKLGIPIVAVVDTNSSPDGIDYVIPGNDDAIRAIRLYLEGVANAVIESQEVVPDAIEGDADEYIEYDVEQHKEIMDPIASDKPATQLDADPVVESRDEPKTTTLNSEETKNSVLKRVASNPVEDDESDQLVQSAEVEAES